MLLNFTNLFIAILCFVPFVYLLFSGLTSPMQMENPPEELVKKAQVKMIASLGIALIGLWYLTQIYK